MSYRKSMIILLLWIAFLGTLAGSGWSIAISQYKEGQQKSQEIQAYKKTVDDAWMKIAFLHSELEKRKSTSQPSSPDVLGKR